MNKRINIILPETTVAILDHVTAKGSRSRLIDQAIRQFVRKQSRNSLREKLKREALVNADRDLAMSAEWLPLEQEAWQEIKRRRSTKRK